MEKRKHGASQVEARQEAPPGDPHLGQFVRFLSFFSSVFAKPGFLDDVPCRDSFKADVPRSFRKTFGQGLEVPAPGHLKWFQRLQPILRMPRGSKIVDFGGGYGMDSIFLASCGLETTHYERTLDHIAIAQHFRKLWEDAFGPLSMRSLLASPAGAEPFGEIDAVMLHEVAHHIAPVEAVFERCSKILQPGGVLFLLEPNFTRRGKRIARRFGFHLQIAQHVVPYGLTIANLSASWRHFLQDTPVLRSLASSHITYQFVKTLDHLPIEES